MNDKMTAGDKSLLTGPYLTLTSELWQQIKAGVEAHEMRYNEEFPKLVEACPEETRLAVACWVMKALYQHAHDGGTYRYLIYHRLGFGPDSYAPCMFAHGLDISNEFVIARPSDEDKHIADTIKAAYEKLPVGDERSALVDAYLRLLELAEHAARSVAIIDAQRAEIADLLGLQGSVAVPPVAHP